VTAPATLLPAIGAAVLAGAYEAGNGVNERSVLLVGSVAAVGLGAALAVEEQNYLAGGLLAAAGAFVAWSMRR
jgi:hypothetical protein